MNIHEYAAKHGITIANVTHEGYERDEDGWDYYAMKIQLQNASNANRKITVPWKQGMAHEDRVPEVGSVLSAVLSDADSWATNPTVEEFADTFGYEIHDKADQRRVNKVYTACKAMHVRAVRFLGSEDEFDYIMGTVALD